MPAVMQSAPTPVQVGHLADPTILLLEEGETMHRMLQICRGVSCSECANA